MNFSHEAQESPFTSELEENDDDGLRAGGRGVNSSDCSSLDLWTTISELPWFREDRSSLDGTLNLNVRRFEFSGYLIYYYKFKYHSTGLE